ncbi:MAG TPA: hypothetical protein VI248_18385, partial [Kineosporiaceae bacterium]
AGVTVLGSLLGRVPVVKQNIEAILLLIVAVSVIPIGVEYLRERARRRRSAGAPPGEPAASQVPGTPAFPPQVRATDLPRASRGGGRHASNG